MLSWADNRQMSLTTAASASCPCPVSNSMFSSLQYESEALMVTHFFLFSVLEVSRLGCCQACPPLPPPVGRPQSRLWYLGWPRGGRGLWSTSTQGRWPWLGSGLQGPRHQADTDIHWHAHTATLLPRLTSTTSHLLHNPCQGKCSQQWWQLLYRNNHLIWWPVSWIIVTLFSLLQDSCALLRVPQEYRPAQHRLPPVPGADPAPGLCWCSASVSRGLSRAVSRLSRLSHDVTHPGVATWQCDGVQWQQCVLHWHWQHLAAGQQHHQQLGDEESDCECEGSIQNFEKFEGIHSKSFLQ